jgi:hypothetical protein
MSGLSEADLAAGRAKPTKKAAGEAVQAGVGGCDRGRRSAMSLKQDFADHVKSQSEIWRAQIKDYQGQLERTGARRL